MNGKQILDEVFGLTFKKGNYLKQLALLDAQGMVSRAIMIKILCKLLEALDEAQVSPQDNVAKSTRSNTRKSI